MICSNCGHTLADTAKILEVREVKRTYSDGTITTDRTTPRLVVHALTRDCYPQRAVEVLDGRGFED